MVMGLEPVIQLRTHDHGVCWGEAVEVLQVERGELLALSIAGSDDVQGIVDGSTAAVLVYGFGHDCLVVCGGALRHDEAAHFVERECHEVCQ